MKMEGKISEFGGSMDKTMLESNDSGLAFWEHIECDKRPDLFHPRSTDPLQKTWQRLRNLHAFYIALNVPHGIDRYMVHHSLFKVANLKTGQYILGQLVDRGPSARGRLVDASTAVLTALRLETDDEVEVEEVTQFGIPFGLFQK